MALIHGKQLRDLLASSFYTTGSTATNGQILTYDSSNGGVLWSNLSSLAVTSIIGGDGIGVDNSTGSVTISAKTDNTAIFIENDEITLGDALGNIGGNFTFTNDIVVSGNFTVNGTTTIINTETVEVADNFMTLNSNFTGSAATQNAGIQVERGDELNAFLMWDEANDWWAISNPDNSGGTGTTYPILTTQSVESTDSALVINQGTGLSADTLYFSINESNLTNIPNSALENSSITISDDDVVTGSTSVSLGGTLNIGLAPNSILESHLNVTNSPIDNYILSYDQGSGGFTWVDIGTITQDTYVTGATATYTGPSFDNNSITISLNNGASDVTISNIRDTFVTGGTLTGNDIILTRNDGNTVSIDISAADFNDTFVTGGTFDNGTGLITFTNNDGGTFTVDLNSLDLNDTFATGATVSNGSLEITGNAGFGTISATGTIIQSVSGNAPITASTTNGAVTVGLDYSSLQHAVPTTLNKNHTPSVTSGNEQTTGISISGTPANDGYVGVSVNGVWYNVGDGSKSLDCYFSADSGSTAKSISSITVGDVLYWNGVISGFNLDTDDRISLHYNVVQ
jgi:hypothetical protein